MQVLRGYLGDRNSRPVFEGQTPFDVLGPGYQRPFELATLRLSNMIGILPKCGKAPQHNARPFLLTSMLAVLHLIMRWHRVGGELCPEETSLLTQQGGCLVFKGKDVIFRHSDSGILKYTDCDTLLKALQLAPV